MGHSVGLTEARTQDAGRLVMLVLGQKLMVRLFAGKVLPGAHQVLGQPLCLPWWFVGRGGGLVLQH